MKSRDIRKLFIEFFAERGHVQLPSSSLIPPSNDPTVLLTTAGMQQMTPFFLGLEVPPAPRLISIQKCFRTVDIDEVGDESHNTFFEMLGNFSVGDYFKKDAIRFAWDFLTGVLQIDPARINVTVYPEDDEARGLWQSEVGLAPDRIYDDPSNIWGPVGDSGPCGPDSEIYVDRGAQYGCGEPDCGPNCPRCDRHLEVWNLVFMQYFQERDGTRRELEKKNIDTGMGLERISLIMQDVEHIYETDLFMPVIVKAAEIAGVQYGANERHDRSLRIIADHTRAAAFLVGDGVLPGNEGRNYVLRRILRRAVRHGRLLGIERPFLNQVIDVVAETFGDEYPELRSRRETIRRVVTHEEEAFGRTLAAGIARFDALADELRSRGATTVPGAEAFRLYDTLGFPFELTVELAHDAGLEVDTEGFQRALEAQRNQSRAALKEFADSGRERLPLYAAAKGVPVAFVGYDNATTDATITDIFSADGDVAQLEAGQSGEVVLDRTVFYGESGGQVGDTGTISTETGVFVVHDTQRPTPHIVVHRGEVREGFIRTEQSAVAAIDFERRKSIQRNHTATHLLHRALRIVLGEDTQQAGSLVAPDRLRFDFTSLTPLGAEGSLRVARIANDMVISDAPVVIFETSHQDAVARGAMALFGEKYGDVVRVVEVPGYSAELCGGAHVARTGEIGPIIILSEASIGSGIRRIEAITGAAALDYIATLQSVTQELARSLRTPVEHLPQEVRTLSDSIRERDRRIDALRLQLAAADVDSLLAGAVSVNGSNVLAVRVDAENRDTLLQVGDRLRDKLASAVVVLGGQVGDQPALVAMVTRDLTARGVHAGKIVQELAPLIGGRGGGRPELAQGGGSDISRLDAALASVEEIVKRQISG
ncbi:MAG: alanine--tRNA ligase [Chloroflexi bacterium]|nr:MAG: alanine--tRNA ligase [Chloroflexota bacterium]